MNKINIQHTAIRTLYPPCGQDKSAFRGAFFTPTTAQHEFLREPWNDLADHMKGALAKHGHTISTQLQGTYKYITLIKPVRHSEEYDVELGLYFEWGDDQK